jgi:DNA-binding response OmpR family regulator
MDGDQAALIRIAAGLDLPGKVQCRTDIEAALQVIKENRLPIVLCDDACGWREMLEDLKTLPDPPFLIVTSVLADDRLWSEALNLGAYDVLAKPFRADEVARVLNMAWLRWAKRSKPRWTLPLFQHVNIAAGTHIL